MKRETKDGSVTYSFVSRPELGLQGGGGSPPGNEASTSIRIPPSQPESQLLADWSKLVTKGIPGYVCHIMHRTFCGDRPSPR